MLRTISGLIGYVLEAEDGDIGQCADFLFDQDGWTIRYMVADTRRWLPGRKVLVSPIALGRPDWESRRFPVKLTREQIEASPPLDEQAPVSRRYERRWYQHFGWPYYWGGDGMWGAGPYPSGLWVGPPYPARTAPSASQATAAGDEPEEGHLRSVREVQGYAIHAIDGDIGEVVDFIVDDLTWSIRYLVVDTGTWLSGRQVLIAPAWVDAVGWTGKKVAVDLTSDDIKNSPEYDTSRPVSREYEAALHDHYNRPKYWEHD